MLNSIEGFDYGINKEQGGESFRYAPRSIESIKSPDSLDIEFGAIISALRPGMKETEREEILSKAGRGIGQYLNVSAAMTGKGMFAEGEVRAMAEFQGFLERQLLVRGVTFVHLLREPSLLGGINMGAPFMHAEHINEKMRGAAATYGYIKSIEQDPNVLFVGCEVNLDCRHAIDLVVARGEGDILREVDLVQVKNLRPSRPEIASIFLKHKGYAAALLNYEASGVGTDENDRRLQRMSEQSPEDFKAKMAEFTSFYSGLLELNAMLEPTWESLIQAADKFNCNPILFYIRLKCINDTRLALVPRRIVQIVLRAVKEKVDKITIPQSALAAYNRATRGPQHITSADEIYSTIVANGEIIQRVKLTN
jgi:hypothetical protein